MSYYGNPFPAAGQPQYPSPGAPFNGFGQPPCSGVRLASMAHGQIYWFVLLMALIQFLLLVRTLKNDPLSVIFKIFFYLG